MVACVEEEKDRRGHLRLEKTRNPGRVGGWDMRSALETGEAEVGNRHQM